MQSRSLPYGERPPVRQTPCSGWRLHKPSTSHPRQPPHRLAALTLSVQRLRNAVIPSWQQHNVPQYQTKPLTKARLDNPCIEARIPASTLICHTSSKEKGAAMTHFGRTLNSARSALLCRRKGTYPHHAYWIGSFTSYPSWQCLQRIASARRRTPPAKAERK